jgi:hypothetical protein
LTHEVADLWEARLVVFSTPGRHSKLQIRTALPWV